jgi:hypothetical protein
MAFLHRQQSPLMAAARALKVEHHPVNLSAGLRVDGPWHVQNVNAYDSRLKGVASPFSRSFDALPRFLPRLVQSH